MLTKEEAIIIAENHLHPMPKERRKYELIITEVIELPYAWIFCYNSKKYVETGDVMAALGGNSPLFISKYTGQIDGFRSGLSIDGMIVEYEELHGIWTLALVDDSVYKDTRKLLGLKGVLQLSNVALASYKKEKRILLQRGGEHRLRELYQILQEKGISTALTIAGELQAINIRTTNPDS